jgi:hypothetical protein
MHTRARIQPKEMTVADAKRLLSPSWDWLLDRGFMGSLGLIAGPAETGIDVTQMLHARVSRVRQVCRGDYEVKGGA